MFGRAVLSAVFLSLLAAVGFAAPAAAQSSGPAVAQTLAGMAEINAAMKKLQLEANQLLAENENEQKKQALWHEQLETRIPEIYSSFVVRRDKSLAEEKRLTDEINRFNSVCGGEVTQPQYDKCMSEAPVLQSAREKNIAERNVLIQEEKDIYNEQQKYLAEIEKSNAVITNNFARHWAIMDDHLAKKAKLEEYRQQLVRQCNEAEDKGDGEALAHCHSISWDGTRGSLPPLEEILRGTRFFGE